MNRTLTRALAAGALTLAALPAAFAQVYRDVDRDVDEVRIDRMPGWSLAAGDGICRLRVYVDDRARVELRGDQVVVRTQTGQRSYDQGTVCNQPLPPHVVDNFRVTRERGRGAVVDVIAPNPVNGYTASLDIHDPQNAGDNYDITIAWRNPGTRVEPLAAVTPVPGYDETRACQERVRADFIARNRDGDAYLEFNTPALRDAMGPVRDRITGEAMARNRVESRPVTYECIVNERTNRVVRASYEVRPRSRYSSLY